jgi:hypothetical protein
MLVAKDPAVLAAYAAQPQWLPPPPARVRPWTDDYTNLIGAMVGSLQKRRWTWQTEAETRRASQPAPPPAPPAPPAGR